MSDLFTTLHKPDVLSCLSDLSNDEVFTPPNIVNDMLDLLPQDLFSNPNITFLDPVCKSGVFLREIAKRLIKGLKPIIPDLQERLDHIFHKQLYGISITELTSLLSRRSVYCSKYPNSPYSVSQFDNIQGNIRYKQVEHEWIKGKCCFCGATESEYGTTRREGMESHAYEFIHTVKPQEIFKMKFDVIIGNPPYQLSDGGAQASAKSIYHLFVEQAKKLNPRFLIMIIPARWYTNGKGKGVDEFRKNMLNDRKISKLVDFANSADCFPGVTIAGGVCYFLWDNSYNGICEISNVSNEDNNSICQRYLNEFEVLVRNNIAVQIIRKTKHFHEKMLNSFVKSYSYFAVRSYERGLTIRNQLTDLTLLSSNGKGYYSKEKIIDKENILDKYKVIITYAMSGGNKPSADGNYQVISSLQILQPNEICTETYLIIGVFDEINQAQNMVSYAKTKLFRFLLLQALTSIHITKDSFCFVPMQDFQKRWTDKELYVKYDLSDEEIRLIESMIKPMES